MNDNIFFDTSKLAYVGENVIIGKTVRIRYPELVFIRHTVIIDHFTYISTSLCLGNFVHIASGCKLIGGRQSKVSISNFSTLAPNVTIASGSDDYLSGIASPMIPAEYKGDFQTSSVLIGNHCIVGAGSVLLPNAKMNNGSSVGALSLVNSVLEEWSLYAGIPAKFIKRRNESRIKELESKFLETHRLSYE